MMDQNMLVQLAALLGKWNHATVRGFRYLGDSGEDSQYAVHADCVDVFIGTEDPHGIYCFTWVFADAEKGWQKAS